MLHNDNVVGKCMNLEQGAQCIECSKLWSQHNTHGTMPTKNLRMPHFNLDYTNEVAYYQEYNILYTV